MREIINENLGVYSCSIADLTMDQACSFLKQWNDGSAIGSLTVFNDINGKVFINADSKGFETYKEIVLNYLNLTHEEQEEAQDNTNSLTLKRIFQVLDNALICREKLTEEKAELKKWLPVKKILGMHPIPNKTELDMIDTIYSEARDIYMARISLYSYAFIQGKRAERARRRKSNNTIVHKNI